MRRERRKEKQRLQKIQRKEVNAMAEIIGNYLISGWIGDRLRQALEDGYFTSGEDIYYFAKHIFVPMFSFCYLSILYLVAFILLVLIVFNVVLLLVLLIYYRIRKGRVIHLYPPKKQPPFNRKV